jgi:hypothetical protein
MKFYFFGMDTKAHAIIAFVLAKYPQVEAKVSAEMDSLFEGKRRNHSCTEIQVTKLEEYLTLVI